MACRSQTILSSLFQGRSTFKPAPVKEKSSIRQVPSAILPILNYRDPLYLNPIVFDSIRRNEVSEKGPSLKSVKNAAKNGTPLYLFADECRQQRSTLLLRHVDYVIEAHFELTDKAGPSDNEGKHIDIFRRRARNGECFQQPCLGCREFPAYFSLLEEEDAMPASSLAHDAPRDLGYMLYDIDYAHGMKPLFYRPRLEQGIIDVARWKRETLCI